MVKLQTKSHQNVLRDSVWVGLGKSVVRFGLKNVKPYICDTPTQTGTANTPSCVVMLLLLLLFGCCYCCLVVMVSSFCGDCLCYRWCSIIVVYGFKDNIQPKSVLGSCLYNSDNLVLKIYLVWLVISLKDLCYMLTIYYSIKLWSCYLILPPFKINSYTYTFHACRCTALSFYISNFVFVKNIKTTY